MNGIRTRLNLIMLFPIKYNRSLFSQSGGFSSTVSLIVDSFISVSFSPLIVQTLKPFLTSTSSPLQFNEMKRLFNDLLL